MFKKLKQRFCGFDGHDFFGQKGENVGVTCTVRLVCRKCGYKTTWYKISDLFEVWGNTLSCHKVYDRNKAKALVSLNKLYNKEYNHRISSMLLCLQKKKR